MVIVFPNKMLQTNENSATSLSWRGQKSVVSVVTVIVTELHSSTKNCSQRRTVVSCLFPNSITTTCCQQVVDFPVYGETCVMDFGHYQSINHLFENTGSKR